MTIIVHEGHVVKSDRVVFQQLALNKHWLPDDILNEIKDYLYISKEEALRKYYRELLHKSIKSVVSTSQICVDMFNRTRLTDWYKSGEDNIHLHGTVCSVCGVGTTHHHNIDDINGGICTLEWDDVDFDIDDEGQHHIPIMKIGWMKMPIGTRGRYE